MTKNITAPVTHTSYAGIAYELDGKGGATRVRMFEALDARGRVVGIFTVPAPLAAVGEELAVARRTVEALLGHEDLEDEGSLITQA